MSPADIDNAAMPAAAHVDHVTNRRNLWIGRAHELGAEMDRLRGAGARGTANGEEAEVTIRLPEDASEACTSEEASTSEEACTVGLGLGFKAFAQVAELDTAVDVHGDARPAIFFLSGSSGIAGDTLRYLRMFASLGHLVVCPDDFCGWPRRLRYREPRRIKPGDAADYWKQNLLYMDAPATGELVYESCAEMYTSSNRLAMVYDCTLRVKFTALTRVLVELPAHISKRGIYLAGNSEGAIVLGMMDDDVLDPSSEVRRLSGNGLWSGTLTSPHGRAAAEAAAQGFKMAAVDEPAKLLGRINIAYSLEPNYFTYRTLKRVRTASLNMTVPPGSPSRTGVKPGLSRREDGSNGQLASVVSGEVFPMLSDQERSEKGSGEMLTIDTDAQNVAMTLWDTDDGGGGADTPGSGLDNPSIMNAHRGLFGSLWRRDVPTLCINGSEDQFFGRRGSVSEDVVRRARPSEVRNGDRPYITGDAGQRMSELGMTMAFVAQMEGAKHAMCPTHDLALRALMADFLAVPELCASIPKRWEEDSSKAGLILWHASITSGQCSFGSMAATKDLLDSAREAVAAAATSSTTTTGGPIAAVARRWSDASWPGSFLDLTSGLAKFARGRDGVAGASTTTSASATPSCPSTPVRSSQLGSPSGGNGVSDDSSSYRSRRVSFDSSLQRPPSKLYNSSNSLSSADNSQRSLTTKGKAPATVEGKAAKLTKDGNPAVAAAVATAHASSESELTEATVTLSPRKVDTAKAAFSMLKQFASYASRAVHKLAHKTTSRLSTGRLSMGKLSMGGLVRSPSNGAMDGAGLKSARAKAYRSDSPRADDTAVRDEGAVAKAAEESGEKLGRDGGSTFSEAPPKSGKTDTMMQRLWKKLPSLPWRKK